MHLPRQRNLCGISALTVALLACAIPSVADAAAKRADLSVSDVRPLTPSVVQKGQVKASVAVRNAGKAGAPGSAVALYLSADRRKSKSDKRLSGLTKVKGLRKGARATATAKAKLPKNVKRGAYVLLACADDQSKAKESNERNNCRPAKGKVGVTVAAKPVGVGPHFDTGTTADGPVRADGGGTVIAVGPDGTSYTLIVPDRALTHDLRITLTPITSIDRLPLSGGLVAGVQVDGDALQLAKPAQLVIQRQGLSPAPSQIAFGYHGFGSDFFLSPFGQRPAGYPSDSIVIPVLHGGGYGVANATSADVAAQQAKTPARAEDELAQAAAVLGGAAKRSALVRAAGLDYAALQTRARQLYTERIQPQMTAAETNDAILPQALRDAFGWMRELTLLGIDDQFQKEFDQISDSMVKAVNNAYDKAKERCAAGDYNQVTRLIQIERMRQLLGFAESKSNIGEDIDKCLSFELRVTSHIEVHENPGSSDHVDGVSDLTATVPLRLDPNTMRLSGQAPFEYKHFSWDTHVTAGCASRTESPTGTLLNGVLDVPSAMVSTNDPGAPPSPPEVSMIIDPGQPQEEIHYVDTGCGTDDSGNQLDSHWLFEWQTFFHLADAFEGGTSGPWFFDKFTPGVKPVVGTRTFNMTVGARSITETWEVVHTPKL